MSDTSLIVRRWGAGSVEPLTFREDNNGDIVIDAHEDGLGPSDCVFLHGDDAERVGRWLIEFSERAKRSAAESPKRATPAELVELRAARVRESLANLTCSPVCKRPSDDVNRQIGPLIVDYCRLLVEQWMTARDCPQQLSMTIIHIRDEINTSWARENAECHTATATIDTNSDGTTSGDPPTKRFASTGSATS